jgi:hypothetical protein
MLDQNGRNGMYKRFSWVLASLERHQCRMKKLLLAFPDVLLRSDVFISGRPLDSSRDLPYVISALFNSLLAFSHALSPSRVTDLMTSHNRASKHTRGIRDIPTYIRMKYAINSLMSRLSHCASYRRRKAWRAYINFSSRSQPPPSQLTPNTRQ